MKKRVLQITIALVIFALGILSGALLRTLQKESGQQIADMQQAQPEGDKYPLTPELVYDSLHTRIIRTKNLTQNSYDDILWRWLKQSVNDYIQDGPKLSDPEERQVDEEIQNDPVTRYLISLGYVIAIHSPSTLSINERKYYNQKLQDRGLPLLDSDGRYTRVQIVVENLHCANWIAFIDPVRMKLVYADFV